MSAKKSGGGGKPSLGELTARLEDIVAALERDPLELDAAIGLFEEAVGHLRRAEEILDTAELRIDELVGEGDEARLRPFEPDEE